MGRVSKNTSYLYSVIWIVLLLKDLTEGTLVISPSENQFKVVNSAVMFTCSVQGYESTELPNIRWKNVVGEYISSTTGRIYIEKGGPNSVKLYISRIYEADAGLYTCQYDHNGIMEFADIKLSIYEEIRFEDTQTLIRTAGTGASPLLPCLATGQPPPVISWRFKGRKLINGKNDDDAKYRYETGGLRIFNVEASDNGTYECRAEEFSQGKFQIRHVTLDVLYKPVIHGGPTSLTAVEGQKVELKCDASGNPDITYEWFREQKMSDMIKVKVRLQGNKSTYVIKSMMKTDVGRYFCKVVNKLGDAESFADIDIIIPPSIKDLSDKVILEGMTAYIPCEATGDPHPRMTWKKEGSEREYLEGTQPDDNNIEVHTNQAGLSKLTLLATRRSYAGTYTCIARNSAGETRKSVKVTVHYYPTASISSTKLLGWPGQVRNVTCIGTGQPPPTVIWFRDKQFITNSSEYEVVTKTRDKSVISKLTINVGKQQWIYNEYKCTVKNKYDYKTVYVDLVKAELPGMPKNIKVEYTSYECILLQSDFPLKNGTFPVTGWRIEYDSREHAQSGVQFYELGEQLKLTGLRAATEYTIKLSCGSKIGYGPSSKFEVKTPEQEVQADLPVLMPGNKTSHGKNKNEEKPSINSTYIGANKGADVKVKEVKILEADSESKGLSTALVAGSTAGLLIISFLVVFIVCFVQKKKRRNSGLYIGRKQVDYGSNIYTSPGIDVDNIQLADIRIKTNPLPDVVHPDKVKSPLEARKTTPKSRNRSVDSNLVNLAGKTPTLQKQAWEQMKKRQDEFISDEEEEDDEFIDEPNPELPLPPPFLLNNSEEHIINDSPRDEDSECYQDVIEGYCSGDNMDDVEEADFELRVPSGYGHNTYISYDPVT